MKRAITNTIIILGIAVSLHATPIHEQPKWYVAEVTTDGQRTLYGPWKSAAKAKTFCAAVPTTEICEARAIVPAKEWERKGAR